MKTVLFIFCSLTVSGQNLYKIQSYRDREGDHNVAILIAYQGDSIMTYAGDVGYLWWKITQSRDIIINDKTHELEGGEFYLENKLTTSFLIVNTHSAIQLIHLGEFVLTLEFKKRKL